MVRIIRFQKKRILFWVSILTVLIGGVFFASKTYSSQIKNVQSTVTYFTDVDDTILTSLSNAVDTNNSLILQTVEVDVMNTYGSRAKLEYGGEGTGLFTTYFEDIQTLNITRSRHDLEYSVTAHVGNYVVEYLEGVKIFSGTSAVGPDVYTRDILLPETIDLNKSFPLLTVRGCIMQSDETETQFFKATFPDANTLRIERLDLPTATNYTPAPTMYVFWQVVEIETDALVKSGTASIAYNASSATVDLTANPISDVNKAFLVFNYMGGAGIDGAEGLLLVRGTITDANTLTFNRAATGSSTDENVDIAWYVVELTDSSSLVQKGTASIASGATSTSVTLTNPVDLTRAFPIISTSGGDTSTITNLSDDFVRAEITTTTTSGDTLALSRHTSAVATDIDWFVVEFAPLTLKSPNGGEVWRVGETHDITWKHADSLESGGSGADGHHLSDIKLDTNGGADGYPLTIATGVDATLDSYSWTIPATIDTVNLIGTNLKVRIIDTDLATRNYDDSNDSFEIKGTLTLTAPNGGELWYIGDSDKYITWDYTGELGTVSLYYDTNSGNDDYPNLIASGISVGSGGSGSYNWNPIPDLPYKTMRVKVIADSDSTVFDTSDDDFEIRPKITITAPDLGTEVWPAQTTQNIEWTSTGTVDSVDIYYSTNTGVDWTLIVSDYTSGSPYGWLIPVEAIGDQTKIKIERSGDPEVFDTSPDGGEGVFSIVPSIEVTSPTLGTEVWRVGETHDITWDINGTIDTVEIEYSADGGSTYNLIASDVTASDGTYAWTIPDNISDTCLVRIYNSVDSTMYDVSDNYFKITGKITVTYPNGGETFVVDSTEVIKWTKSGSIGNVEIRYSTDGGTTYPNLITPADGVPASDLNYTWSPIPDDISDTVKIKIVLLEDTSVNDASDSDFFIKGSLTVTAPDGGETFYVGDTTDITWSKTGTLGNIELRYSTDGGVTFPDTQVIDTGIPASDLSYTWTIPDAISNNVRVQIFLISDPAVSDTSNDDFSIKGTLTLTAPNGGEVWRVGTYENITWTRLGSTLGNVKLEYSINDGSDGYPYLIASSIPSGDLSYSWEIPDAIGNLLKVKITSEDDPATTDTSDDVFSIKGRLVLSAPTGGEIWYVGTQENITWDTYGTIDKVNLYYSTDGGVTYSSTIVTAATNVDGYLWTIPDAIGTTTRVKIEQYGDSEVYDTSPNDFTIKGRIVVDTPNGGEVWYVGETQSIIWSAYGSIGNVEIRYSTDGGTTYPDDQIITPAGGVPATDGSFAWTIPDSVGINNKIKITSLDYPDVSDESDDVFSIKPSINVTSPNGGEAWVVENTYDITWETTGTISTVKLEYSTNGFSDETETVTIATSV
ncbi:MAG: hypothetical protein DRP27_07830, partial [Thermotogae bacterium]